MVNKNKILDLIGATILFCSSSKVIASARVLKQAYISINCYIRVITLNKMYKKEQHRRRLTTMAKAPFSTGEACLSFCFNKKHFALRILFGLITCAFSFLMIFVLANQGESAYFQNSDGDNNKDDVGDLQIDLDPTANVFEACTKDDLVIMAKQLQDPSAATRCPDSNWIDDLYQKGLPLGSKDGSFLGVSIGCNKGFDAINTARMGMKNMMFDKQAWNENLLALGVRTRGACGQDASPQYELKMGSEPARRGEMHCVEPIPSTVESVKMAANELNLYKEGFVVTQAAISSRDGEISFPAGKDENGRETYSMDSCNNQQKKNRNHCVDIPMYSLQTYIDTYVKSKGPINILSIDVEGFDFNVLFGAGSVLDRTQYLEFEYHQVGSWGKLHVQDLVHLLDGKGFNCYWAGKKKLWRSTKCELEKFDKWHGWSNIACVHRSQNELAQNMENIFRTTIGKA